MRASMLAISCVSRRMYQEPELVRTLRHIVPQAAGLRLCNQTSA